MGRKSRTKGKRGELEAKEQIRLYWFAPEARRSQQYSGHETSADIVGALPGAHVECKRLKAIGALSYLEQAERDKAEEDFGLVVMRKDRDPEWVVMFRLKDSERFADALIRNRQASDSEAGCSGLPKETPQRSLPDHCPACPRCVSACGAD